MRELPEDRATITAPISLSIIIPVKNGGEAFRRCLSALKASNTSDFELIVVDDASTDDSPSLATSHGARLITTQGSRPRLQGARHGLQPHRGASQSPISNQPSATLAPHASAGVSSQQSHGPCVARNLGARVARGEALFFIDADVAVRPDTVGRVVRAFAADPDLVAAFGSYDERPSDPGFISQYKNLFHHYVHQHARAEASTFWAGCGAIRRSAFFALGGFDEANYRRPSIEDIDLGYRLARRGAKIRVCGRTKAHGLFCST
ncbi:MAG: glycosyltransferase family 2 protein [Chloroflexi bacterium]|nr:glycosyltransferase family 2 protein [Chloroflexota bacterium]